MAPVTRSQTRRQVQESEGPATRVAQRRRTARPPPSRPVPSAPVVRQPRRRRRNTRRTITNQSAEQRRRRQPYIGPSFNVNPERGIVIAVNPDINADAVSTRTRRRTAELRAQEFEEPLATGPRNRGRRRQGTPMAWQTPLEQFTERLQALQVTRPSSSGIRDFLRIVRVPGGFNSGRRRQEVVLYERSNGHEVHHFMNELIRQHPIDIVDPEEISDSEASDAEASTSAAPVAPKRKRRGRPRKTRLPADTDVRMDSLAACTICCEDEPKRPVACRFCRQPIGCRYCVKKWFRTTNLSHLDARPPFSLSLSHRNHHSCPLCRAPWGDTMKVVRVVDEAGVPFGVKNEVNDPDVPGPSNVTA